MAVVDDSVRLTCGAVCRRAGSHYAAATVVDDFVRLTCGAVCCRAGSHDEAATRKSKKRNKAGEKKAKESLTVPPVGCRGGSGSHQVLLR